jgi:hypothetical protein
VRAWGERAKQHFRRRHLALRERAQHQVLDAPGPLILPAKS